MKTPISNPKYLILFASFIVVSVQGAGIEIDDRGDTLNVTSIAMSAPPTLTFTTLSGPIPELVGAELVTWENSPFDGGFGSHESHELGALTEPGTGNALNSPMSDALGLRVTSVVPNDLNDRRRLVSGFFISMADNAPRLPAWNAALLPGILAPLIPESLQVSIPYTGFLDIREETGDFQQFAPDLSTFELLVASTAPDTGSNLMLTSLGLLAVAGFRVRTLRQ